MSERDDYLLDPAAGPPDREIEALERALAPLRWRATPWTGPQAAPRPAPRRRWPWFAAAAAVLLAALLWWSTRAPHDVALRRDSAPRTFVAAARASTIRLGELAELTLQPGSELAFVHWRADEARFDLRRGVLEARVAPPPTVPPRFFVVGTAFGRVVDQGCRYTLEVLPDQRVRVRVVEGAVTFEFPQRTVFVPAGASTEVDAAGPTTPCFDDAPADLLAAVRADDALARAKATDFDARAASVKRVLQAVRREADSLVLWHLLRDDDELVRTPAREHLVELVGLPPATKGPPEDPEEWLPFLRLGAWRTR